MKRLTPILFALAALVMTTPGAHSGKEGKRFSTPNGCEMESFQFGNIDERVIISPDDIRPVVDEGSRYRINTEEKDLLEGFEYLFHGSAIALQQRLKSPAFQIKKKPIMKKPGAVWDLNWDVPGAGLEGRIVTLLLDRSVKEGEKIGFDNKTKKASEWREVEIWTGIIYDFQTKMGFGMPFRHRSLKNWKGKIQLFNAEQSVKEFTLNQIKGMYVFGHQMLFSNIVNKTEPLSYFNFGADPEKPGIPTIGFSFVSVTERQMMLKSIRDRIQARVGSAIHDSGYFSTKKDQDAKEVDIEVEPKKTIRYIGPRVSLNGTSRVNWDIDIKTTVEEQKENEPLYENGSSAQGRINIVDNVKGTEIIIIQRVRSEEDRELELGVRVITGKITHAYEADSLHQVNKTGRYIRIKPDGLEHQEINLNDILDLWVVVPN